jgi:hypothetical protein
MRNYHVRVDIFYRPASISTKAIIDLIGVFIFLLPYTFVVLHLRLALVTRSWRFMEMSGNTGGMPGLFVLKSFIIVFASGRPAGHRDGARSILVLAGPGRLAATIPALSGRQGVSRDGSRYFSARSSPV